MKITVNQPEQGLVTSTYFDDAAVVDGRCRYSINP